MVSEQVTFQEHYNVLIANAKNAQGGKKHYILPLSEGGTKEASNIVYLTVTEVFWATFLLRKIYLTKQVDILHDRVTKPKRSVKAITTIERECARKKAQEEADG